MKSIWTLLFKTKTTLNYILKEIGHSYSKGANSSKELNHQPPRNLILIQFTIRRLENLSFMSETSAE